MVDIMTRLVKKMASQHMRHPHCENRGKVKCMQPYLCFLQRSYFRNLNL
uniref:Uncharacterized protein n=1 Tax=Rhizophora mucronata TaxID=61149 RepID=A0A2P2PPQ3_RHIMU